MRTWYEPPEDPPAPDRRWISRGDITALVLLIVLVATLASTLLPPICGSWRMTACAGNLTQLYKMTQIYASMHPQLKPFPEGESVWLSLADCEPPIIESNQIEILFCPLKGDDPVPGCTDYRGPGRTKHRCPTPRPIGADKPGNHGAEHGGNVLLVDGAVLEYSQNDDLWQWCELLLKP